MPDLSGLVVLFWGAAAGAAMFTAALLMVPLAWFFALPSMAVLSVVCASGVVAFIAAALLLK